MWVPHPAGTEGLPLWYSCGSGAGTGSKVTRCGSRARLTARAGVPRDWTWQLGPAWIPHQKTNFEINNFILLNTAEVSYIHSSEMAMHIFHLASLYSIYQNDYIMWCFSSMQALYWWFWLVYSFHNVTNMIQHNTLIIQSGYVAHHLTCLAAWPWQLHKCVITCQQPHPHTLTTPHYPHPTHFIMY